MQLPARQHEASSALPWSEWSAPNAAICVRRVGATGRLAPEASARARTNEAPAAARTMPATLAQEKRSRQSSSVIVAVNTGCEGWGGGDRQHVVLEGRQSPERARRPSTCQIAANVALLIDRPTI